MDETVTTERDSTSISLIKSSLQQALLYGNGRKATQERGWKKEDFAESLDEFDRLVSGRDHKIAIDCAFKDLLYEIVRSDHRDSDIVQKLFRTLFDLALILAECEISEQTLPLSLIEEAYDTQTIDGCQKLFSYMEARFERLTVGVDGTKGKGIVLLRLSNELLRRLSKSEDTVFCGRILVFLSKSFPLSEKSGVNLRGEFNVDNKTTFDAYSDTKMGSAAATQAGDEMSDSLNSPTEQPSSSLFNQSSNIEADLDSFYGAFWSLQADFSDPPRLFKDENLGAFKTTLETILRLFRAMSNGPGHIAPSASNADIKKNEKRKRSEEEGALDHYNPKYLTSRELFNLEIRDLVFRRHILVQSYILLDFLLTLTPQAKEYWETENKNKSLQFACTLSEENSKWAEDTKKEIFQSLQLQKGMDGLLFSRTVESVLTREKNWVKWKANNCLSFEKDPIAGTELQETKLQVNSCGKTPTSSDVDMGAPALSRVWLEEQGTSGMNGLRNPKRFCPPNHQAFHKAVEGIQLDLDFADTDLEKEELISAIPSKTWLALRVASKDRFHLFQKLDDELTLKSLVVAEDIYMSERIERSIIHEGKVGEEAS